MTTRSTILFAVFVTCVCAFLSSCNKEKVEYVPIVRPFDPKLGVDSIYWEKHTQPTLVQPQLANAINTNNKIANPLLISTPGSVQVVVENTSTQTIYNINLWARIQGVDQDIRIAYLDKIPPTSTQIYAPTFVHHSVYLPCKSGDVVQLFLPSIIQNSNITVTYILTNE